MVEFVGFSNLSRAMICPGNLSMTNLPPKVTHDSAKEGTACGELLTAMLNQRTVTPKVNNIAGNGVLFDSDMYYYSAEVANHVFNNSQGKIFSETPVSLVTESGITVRGAYDISYVKDGVLHVEDLKYGYSIVDPQENWQLIGYAIGEVMRLGKGFEKIVLTIHQPRPYHEDGPCRSWTISYGELMEYKEIIEKQMMSIRQGDTSLKTGKHCKYCRAASSCAALNRATYNSVDVAMNQLVQDHLSDDQLSRELDTLDRAVDLIKLRKDSLEQLTVNRIKGGGVVKNYVINERWSNRKWKGAVTADVIETLTGKKVTEQVLLSPAKVEKLGISKDFINGMTEKRRIGINVKRKDITKIANEIFGGK